MLVIIGLLVGGVLVGQDMIRAAEVRAEITQIEKFQTATNTFKAKYNALPGDMNTTDASQYGFAPRGTLRGEGDGNGVLEGIYATYNGGYGGATYSAGETVMFWSDLTYANGMNINLIEGSFNQATSNTIPNADIPGTALAQWLPPAKIGRGNYITVWSGGYGSCCANPDANNYFAISSVTSIAVSSFYGHVSSSASMPVSIAYNIDKKIDDGLPQSGFVMAIYPIMQFRNVWWAAGGGSNGKEGGGGAPTTSATAASSTTCYDNANTGGAVEQYSMNQNNGLGTNCALSFQFH